MTLVLHHHVVTVMYPRRPTQMFGGKNFMLCIVCEGPVGSAPFLQGTTCSRHCVKKLYETYSPPDVVTPCLVCGNDVGHAPLLQGTACSHRCVNALYEMYVPSEIVMPCIVCGSEAADSGVLGGTVCSVNCVVALYQTFSPSKPKIAMPCSVCGSEAADSEWLFRGTLCSRYCVNVDELSDES